MGSNLRASFWRQRLRSGLPALASVRLGFGFFNVLFVNVADRYKAQKSKRHPFLRPSEQKQKRDGKAKGRKRPHSYTKLRQALKRR